MTGPDPAVGHWLLGDRAMVRLPDGEYRGEVVTGGDGKLYFRVVRNFSQELHAVDEVAAQFLWR